MTALSLSWFEDEDPRDLRRWAIAAAIVFGFLFWQTIKLFTDQVLGTLTAESRILSSEMKAGGETKLAETVSALSRPQGTGHHHLFGAQAILSPDRHRRPAGSTTRLSARQPGSHRRAPVGTQRPFHAGKPAAEPICRARGAGRRRESDHHLDRAAAE